MFFVSFGFFQCFAFKTELSYIDLLFKSFVSCTFAQNFFDMYNKKNTKKLEKSVRNFQKNFRNKILKTQSRKSNTKCNVTDWKKKMKNLNSNTIFYLVLDRNTRTWTESGILPYPQYEAVHPQEQHYSSIRT